MLEEDLDRYNNCLDENNSHPYYKLGKWFGKKIAKILGPTNSNQIADKILVKEATEKKKLQVQKKIVVKLEKLTHGEVRYRDDIQLFNECLTNGVQREEIITYLEINDWNEKKIINMNRINKDLIYLSMYGNIRHDSRKINYKIDQKFGGIDTYLKLQKRLQDFDIKTYDPETYNKLRSIRDLPIEKYLGFTNREEMEKAKQENLLSRATNKYYESVGYTKELNSESIKDQDENNDTNKYGLFREKIKKEGIILKIAKLRSFNEALDSYLEYCSYTGCTDNFESKIDGCGNITDQIKIMLKNEIESALPFNFSYLDYRIDPLKKIDKREIDTALMNIKNSCRLLEKAKTREPIVKETIFDVEINNYIEKWIIDVAYKINKGYDTMDENDKTKMISLVKKYFRKNKGERDDDYFHKFMMELSKKK